MHEIQLVEDKKEKALLVGVQVVNKTELAEVEELLLELEELVENLEIEVVDTVVAKVQKPHAGLFIGSGKTEEIIEMAKANGCTMIIFDNTLSPVQQRNWEKYSEITVIDRQEVILEIFASRAQTKEAVLQVELAKMEYSMARLRRAWSHLSRQRGGGATQRDAGEKQIELDRRMARDRITQLKKELAEVIQHRQMQRKKRLRVPYPTAAIVGYTNAGKSSLLNKLTNAGVLAEDKLFATLDPTTRRLQLPSGQVLLLTDTVGFIRKLPHNLIEAFKATLEEAVVADFLIHVVDVSNPNFEAHLVTTLRVLGELGVHDKTILLVFNKIDLLEDAVAIASIKAQYPKALFISIKTGAGIDALLSLMEASIGGYGENLKLLIPYDRYDVVHQLYELGAVSSEENTDDGIVICGYIPSRLMKLIEVYIVKKN